MLHLQSAEEGGYIVTSPLELELITQAETLEEAFVNASDAIKAHSTIAGEIASQVVWLTSPHQGMV